MALPSPSATEREAEAIRQQLSREEKIDDGLQLLRQRVDALDPDNADPDMVVEMMRRNLNVVHPDEVILPKPDAPAR